MDEQNISEKKFWDKLNEPDVATCENCVHNNEDIICIPSKNPRKDYCNNISGYESVRQKPNCKVHYPISWKWNGK